MTTSQHTSHTRRARRGPALVLGVAAATFGLAAAAWAGAPGASAQVQATRYAYNWPVKPFHRQHPIRAFFGDPRIGVGNSGGLEHSFHFGIDIHTRNGAPVYASVNGRALLQSFRPETVTVIGDDRRRFEYWHITQDVRSGQRVIANRTVVGHVARWQHVHFAELSGGAYVNPLRPGALGPFRDTTSPVLRDFRVQREHRVLRGARANGSVDLVVEAYDQPPSVLPEPWAGNPVTPARLSWRMHGPRNRPTAWQTAVDFRWSIPPAGVYAAVYADWTRQNKRARTGRYRFFLAHGWDSRSVPNGTYEIEVAAADTTGNVATAHFPIVVAN